MGLIVTKNDNNEYHIVSSVSDECIHDNEWISIDEAKKILIEREFFRFMDSAIQINMDFPNGYSINGKMCNDYEDDKCYFDWALSKKGGRNPEKYQEKLNEILTILELKEND